MLKPARIVATVTPAIRACSSVVTARRSIFSARQVFMYSITVVARLSRCPNCCVPYLLCRCSLTRPGTFRCERRRGRRYTRVSAVIPWANLELIPDAERFDAPAGLYRYGPRRRANHVLPCWEQRSRGWPTCAGHDGSTVAGASVSTAVGTKSRHPRCFRCYDSATSPTRLPEDPVVEVVISQRGPPLEFGCLFS